MKIRPTIIVLILLMGAGCNSGEKLTFHLTSSHGDSITEIKSFYFTSITERAKQIGFKNLQNNAAVFTFKGLKPGIYIGLMEVVKNGQEYHISIDSIIIEKGSNSLTKEINIGYTKMPMPE